MNQLIKWFGTFPMNFFWGAFSWLCFPNVHAWQNSPSEKSCGIFTWSIDLTFANL
jgi:hypothetical protein